MIRPSFETVSLILATNRFKVWPANQTCSVVFSQPKLILREPLIFSSETPIAVKTCDGNGDPELHAEPVETAMPSISRAINKSPPLTPAMENPKVFGKRNLEWPKISTLGFSAY